MDKAASRIRLQLNARRNLWLEILEFCACSGYVAYTQGVDSVVE